MYIFFAVVCITVGAMYIPLPDVPAYPEERSLLDMSGSDAQAESATLADVQDPPIVQVIEPTTNEPLSNSIPQPELADETSDQAAQSASIETNQSIEKETKAIAKVTEQSPSKIEAEPVKPVEPPPKSKPAKVKVQKKSAKPPVKPKVTKAQSKSTSPPTTTKPSKPKAQRSQPQGKEEGASRRF